MVFSPSALIQTLPSIYTNICVETIFLVNIYKVCALLQNFMDQLHRSIYNTNFKIYIPWPIDAY